MLPSRLRFKTLHERNSSIIPTKINCGMTSTAPILLKVNPLSEVSSFDLHVQFSCRDKFLIPLRACLAQFLSSFSNEDCQS